MLEKLGMNNEIHLSKVFTLKQALITSYIIRYNHFRENSITIYYLQPPIKKSLLDIINKKKKQKQEGKMKIKKNKSYKTGKLETFVI